MQVSRILSEIDDEIKRLKKARVLLTKGSKTGARPYTKSSFPKAAKKGGERRWSAEARRKVSETLKARWAERRKASSKASK